MIGRLLPLVLAAQTTTAGAPGAHAVNRPTSMRKEAPELCAAVRGNGELILAHFSSYARLVEHFGLFDGLAGGSSASISMFIYESILQNPELRDCPNCSEADIALRASLLLKSIQAYVSVLGETEEARAISQLAIEVKKLQAAINTAQPNATRAEQGIESLKKTRKRLKTILDSSDLKSLINPEILSAVADSSTTDPKILSFQLNETLEAVRTFGAFKAEDRRIFFRAGLISFPALAEKFARMADFYAGRGAGTHDARGMKEFLDHCAPGSLDRSWEEISRQSPACTDSAHKLIQEYRTKRLKLEAKVPIADSRLNDEVGTSTHILVGTAILEGAQVDRFQEGLRRYRTQDGFSTFDFNVFEGLRFGYWGQISDTRKIAENPKYFDDLKTTKARALPPVSWRVALSHSPAEPGLSRFTAIQGTNLISAAGWTDLAPTLALRNLGCKKVIYITRQGGESPFARGIAKNLGMTQPQDSALYDLENPDSAFSKSIQAADATWCTNWNSYPISDGIAGLVRNSYSGTNLETHDSSFGSEGFPLAPFLSAPTHLGCGGQSPVDAAN
jgi:hypothetical protein